MRNLGVESWYKAAGPGNHDQASKLEASGCMARVVWCPILCINTYVTKTTQQATKLNTILKEENSMLAGAARNHIPQRTAKNTATGHGDSEVQGPHFAGRNAT